MRQLRTLCLCCSLLLLAARASASLAHVPGSAERVLRGLSTSERAQLVAALGRERGIARGESPLGLGTRLWFEPAGLATPARALCGASLCAGVATRPLNAAALQLEERPLSATLRARHGVDAPPLAGYGARSADLLQVFLRNTRPEEFHAHLFRPSTGERDPELPTDVRALVLLDARGEALVWVSADLIGAFQDLRAAVLARLRAAGLDWVHDGNLLFHGNHTHSGLGAIHPRALYQLFTVDRFSAELFERAADQIAGAVLDAHAVLEPARVGLGETQVEGVSRNRRGDCAALGDAPNPAPNPVAGVVRVDRADGSALATVMRFAVHPTSYGASNLATSPDNAGHAEAAIERGGGGIGLFLNGAQGDVAPSGGDARFVGETLANAVLAARAEVETTSEVRLSSAYCQIDEPTVAPDYPRPCVQRLGPVHAPLWKFLEHPLFPGCFLDREGSGLALTIELAGDVPVVEREGVVFAVHALELQLAGRVQRGALAALPAEPITAVGTSIEGPGREANEALDHLWVVGLANAHLGYVVTQEEWVQGGYEAGLNVFGPGQGQVFAGNALALLQELMAR